MAGVVNSKHSNKAVGSQFKAREPTVSGRNPDGLKVGCVECPHQMEYENADGSGVSEYGNSTAPVVLDYLVQLACRTIQHLPVAFPAQQDVIEIAA